MKIKTTTALKLHAIKRQRSDFWFNNQPMQESKWDNDSYTHANTHIAYTGYTSHTTHYTLYTIRTQCTRRALDDEIVIIFKRKIGNVEGNEGETKKKTTSKTNQRARNKNEKKKHKRTKSYKFVYLKCGPFFFWCCCVFFWVLFLFIAHLSVPHRMIEIIETCHTECRWWCYYLPMNNQHANRTKGQSVCGSGGGGGGGSGGDLKVVQSISVTRFNVFEQSWA